MFIRRLTTRAFRNLAAATVEFHPSVNVILGANAQGKTSLAEAVYLLAALRSFRTSQLRELIRHGEAIAGVSAEADDGGVIQNFAVELERGPSVTRICRYQGHETPPARYAGKLRAVAFHPGDLGLVAGLPEARRRFLDRLIFSVSPAYLAEYQAFQHSLRQRNSFLRQGAPDMELLDVYDEQFVRLGAVVMERREKMIAELNEAVDRHYASVAGDGEKPGVRYEPGVSSGLAREGSAADWLRAALERGRPRDLERGFTGDGPHCDDLDLQLDQKPLRKFGSQGQRRTAVVALKVSELEIIARSPGPRPLLLLDDVASELDLRRNRALFEALSVHPAQVFLTTTELSHLPLGPATEFREFAMEQGAITQARDRRGTESP
ncbi:MAG: DNA replication and repair protein RecF [Myxococcota bacterium]|nr:DNA replication and repair protein RecF [Myxococcota bacterium]